MAGKNTFRSGRHPSRNGGWVTPFRLTIEGRRKLEEVAGRALTTIEAEWVRDTLETMRHLAELHAADTVSMQDVKRTLAAIARAAGKDAKQMLEDCDDSTRALIEESLWFDCGLREHGTSALLSPPDDLIADAADWALRRITDNATTGGAPVKGYQIHAARAALHHWRILGRGVTVRRSGWTGGANSLRRNPAARWVRAFLEIVEDRPFRPNEVDKVLRATAR